MSVEYTAPKNGSGFDFSDLIEASQHGQLPKSIQANRRSRKQSLKQRTGQMGMIAPLLALEGCFTIGGKGDPIVNIPEPTPSTPTTPPSSGGGVTPPATVSVAEAKDDDNFHVEIDASVHIAVNDLLANDDIPDGGAELVRVFGAANGTVMMHNGVIMFTPDSGYEGMASFRYEIRDSKGNLSEASVNLHVMEDGDGHQHDSGHGDMPGMGDGGHVHSDDPSKASEHMAMMNLVPVSEATHVAVKDGSWFDASTWAGGEVPGEGAKVVIPEGVSVAYDGQNNASLFTVRVDGQLDFATDKDTFMEVDTFVVSPSGTLTIGTADNPVSANVQTIIQFADNGPIDVSWDPQLLSRGLLSHGEIEVHGAEKTTFLKVATDPMAGDTSITLESAADGWNVGDRLVLTGTHLTYSKEVAPQVARDDQTEDEELVISRIEGNTIYFDTPLQFDHDAPRDDLKAYVANYSRNIRFETENADDLPVHQRGHVMLMHSDTIDIRYAEFSDLGRTDKSERAVDIADVGNVQSDTNAKARYSLHLHRVGVDDPDDPAMLMGNSVWGSPGWGFVQHDSNAILSDNAAYDVYGAAFVAETGNEIGRWVSNIAIKSIGNGGGAKSFEDVQAFDLGRTGAGFWFQGRLVDAVDNVAAGVPGGQGFVWMSRGGGVIKVDPSTADWSESLRYIDEAFANYPVISQFQGNEAIAVGTGLEVIKAGPEQQHDVRSMIEQFTAWEVRTGVHLQYTAHYTLKDIDVIATDGSSGARPARFGIEYGPNTIDMVINGANIEGFPTGFHAGRDAINLNYPFDGDWAYVFIDVNIDGATTEYSNSHSSDVYLTRDQLVEGRLTYDSDLGDVTWIAPPEDHTYVDVTGTKTDSIGAVEVSPTWDPIRHDYFTVRNALVEEGYWTLPDGRKVTAIDQYFADRVTGSVDKVTVFVEWERDFSDVDGVPQYNGVLDLSDNNAAVARTDFGTVSSGGTIDIDVLANDYDPDGGEINIDGLCPPNNGQVFVNEDGSVRYIADPNFTGEDAFMYWLEDDNGNFDKGLVRVTVEA
ncbi:Ig-like domain-containing protein [Hyphococcus lacteus]|uniref:Cadherin-like domain-containing protein n=1 Tax=Hyphococcus lacteus TaxID=3143536 RepID=A0ABV3Z256_9PROT